MVLVMTMMSKTTHVRSIGSQLGFLTLGLALGAGITLLARQPRALKAEKDENLDDLFRKCEDITCKLEREVKNWLAS